jgi:hypothetical protein
MVSSVLSASIGGLRGDPEAPLAKRLLAPGLKVTHAFSE